MQALAARWPVPDACVQAVAAGCDGVLVCSGNTALQFAALEALIHAVEDERLPWSQIEDSLLRHRRMKERFLADPRRPAAGAPWMAFGARPRVARGDRRRNRALHLMAMPSAVHGRWRFPLRKPPALRPGARLAVVAPASAFDVDAFHAGVAELTALGFEASYDASIFERTWYVAGDAGGPRGGPRARVA